MFKINAMLKKENEKKQGIFDFEKLYYPVKRWSSGFDSKQTIFFYFHFITIKKAANKCSLFKKLFMK